MHQAPLGEILARNTLLSRSLNLRTNLNVNETGLGKYFKKTEGLHIKVKPHLELDTYDLLNIPMECVREMFADNPTDTPDKSTAETWFTPRLDTLQKVLSAVDSKLNEIKVFADTTLRQMIGDQKIPSDIPMVYQQFCEDIASIKLQYQEYRKTLNRFNSSAKTPDVVHKYKIKLLKLMDAPQAWIVQALSDPEQWQRIKGRKYHTDTQ